MNKLQIRYIQWGNKEKIIKGLSFKCYKCQGTFSFDLHQYISGVSVSTWPQDREHFNNCVECCVENYNK